MAGREATKIEDALTVYTGPRLEYEAVAAAPMVERRLALHAAFIAGWEAQSQVASVAFLALAAFCPLWSVIAVMLAWALIATVVYLLARGRGVPDLLAVEADRRHDCALSQARSLAGGCLRLWLVGFQAFAFTRATRLLLMPGNCIWRRALRTAVLSLGLTLFGVTTAEHLLRRAGFQGSRLTQLSLLGPFLNVPYRALLSAAVTHTAMSLLHVA